VYLIEISGKRRVSLCDAVGLASCQIAGKECDVHNPMDQVPVIGANYIRLYNQSGT